MAVAGAFAAGTMAAGTAVAGRTNRYRNGASAVTAGWRWHWPADPVPLSDAEVELAAREDPVPPPVAVYSGRRAVREGSDESNLRLVKK